MQKLLQLIDTYKVYFLAAILVIVPLFPKFPFIKIPTTYVAIRIEDFLLLTLGLVVFIYALHSFKDIFKDPIVRALILFFCIGFISVVSASLITQTISFQIGLLHLFRRVEYTVPFFALLILFKKTNVTEGNEYLIKVLMLVIFIIFLYGFGQRYLSFPVIITQNEEYSKGIALRWTPGAHINSTFAGHYDMASFLVLIFPMLAVLFVTIKDIKSRILLAIPLLSSMWLLQASASRISFFAWGISTALALFLVKKYKEILIFGLMAFVLLISSSSLMGRYQRFIDVYKQKLFSLNFVSTTYAIDPTLTPIASTPTPTPAPVFEDRSTNIRLAVEWPRAIRAFEKNILLGTGYSSITLASDNDYLRMLGEIGILGFLSFVLVFYRIIKELLYGIKRIDKFGIFDTALIVGVFSSLVGIFITAIFIDIFEASKFAIVMWTLIGMSIVTIRNKIHDA